MNRVTLRRLLALVGVAYCVGALTAHWTWSRMAAAPADRLLPAETRPPTADAAPSPQGTMGELPSADELAARLAMPLAGVSLAGVRRGFTDSGLGHEHVAVDFVAPRNTPIHAVDAGRIVSLLVTELGGRTIHQFDLSEQYCYYYAHLERYADGLREGAAVARGQIIGYVGTSGNAPPDMPHLNFALFAVGPGKQWSPRTAIDPYPVFR